MAREKNPMAELSELFAIEREDLDPEAQSDGVYYQQRFGVTELVIEDGQVCTVSVGRAFIGLDLSGLTIKPGSELGAVVKANEVIVKHESEKVARGSIAGGAKAKLGALLDSNISGSVQGELEKKNVERSTYESIKTRVTPRGGQMWEIVAIDEKFLNGDYLSLNDALCRVKAKRGANQQEVVAQVFVKQRDLLFRYDGASWLATRLSKNKERLLNILIAKALNARAAAGSHSYTGSLVLSEAVTEFEK